MGFVWSGPGVSSLAVGFCNTLQLYPNRGTPILPCERENLLISRAHPFWPGRNMLPGKYLLLLGLRGASNLAECVQ